MAFGDVVKFDGDNSNAKVTFPLDLGSNPTSGNLLLVLCGSGVGSNTLSTEPAGFTLVDGDNSGNATWYLYYKISVGTEQTTTMTWNTTTGGQQWYYEYEWGVGTPSITTSEDVSNVSTVVNSQGIGTLVPPTASNLCFAFHGTKGNNLSFIGQAVDGSWAEDQAFENGDASRGQLKISRLVNQSGSLTATHTDTDTGAEMYGLGVSFNVETGHTIEIPTGPWR